MKLKKFTKNLLFIIVLFICPFGFSQVLNNVQIIQSGHWIYDGLQSISTELGKNYFIETTPLSVGEIKFYLSEIPYDNLSDAGKNVYEKIQNYILQKKNVWGGKETPVQFSTTLILTPELYYKSNENIDWTFNYKYEDNFLTVPLRFGFSDYFSIGANIYFGKNYASMENPNNLVNLPLAYDEMEFLFPRFAYISGGMCLDNWGWIFHLGKEGKKIGNTLQGSIILNDTFETDGYFDFAMYSKNLRFNFDVIQVDNERFMYTHQLAYIPIKNLKLSVCEGSLVDGPLELRFMNPLMLMHQFAGWRDYVTEEEHSIYSENHFCAYLTFNFEYMPVKNFRLYGLYAQNELQIKSERESEYGNSYPDSLGFQLGLDYILPSSKKAFYKFSLEGIYTSPYLYVKQTPDSSLYKARIDNLNNECNPIQSWIGSPYGPDSIGMQFRFAYEKFRKYSFEFDYILTLHGEIDFDIFTQMDEDGNYIYYPTVKYKFKDKMGLSKNEIWDMANNMGLSGTIEQGHQFVLKGKYYFNEKISLSAQLVYGAFINCDNIKNNFQQGVEMALSFKYNIL